MGHFTRKLAIFGLHFSQKLRFSAEKGAKAMFLTMTDLETTQMDQLFVTEPHFMVF